MKLSAYTIRFDTGFAPNPSATTARSRAASRLSAAGPSRGTSSLAPLHPATITPGALSTPCASKRSSPTRNTGRIPGSPAAGCLKQRPSADAVTTSGIASPTVSGRSPKAACHDESARERDTGGKNALIATEFFYFGRKAICVPAKFSGLLARTQGHKNTYDSDAIDRFWDWLCRTAPKRGRIGDPSEFTDEGCRA
jgi:hypothetical protein